MTKAVARNRLAALLFALAMGAPLALADETPQPATPGVTQAAPPAPAPAPATPAVPAPAAPAPAAPAAEAPAATPPGATPPAAAPPATAEQPSDDSSGGQLVDMPARPAAYIEGKANWTEGFDALMGALATISKELAKSGVAASGRPIAVFVETDDSGFGYRAMIPIDKAPEGKTALSDAVKLGQTPAGRAMKFPHRGSYEDIDSTYEAITAYLDEKGLEMANLFVEEYLNDVKTADDPNLQVDIYVMLK